MRFEDLADFLRVRPGHGVAQEGDDLVETPFVLPGTTEPLVIRVTRMTGEDGPLLVTDGGALTASPSRAARSTSRVFPRPPPKASARRWKPRVPASTTKAASSSWRVRPTS